MSDNTKSWIFTVIIFLVVFTIIVVVPEGLYHLDKYLAKKEELAKKTDTQNPLVARSIVTPISD